MNTPTTQPFGYGIHWFGVDVGVTEAGLREHLPLLRNAGVGLIDFPAGMIDPALSVKLFGELLAENNMEARFCVFHIGYDALRGDGKKTAITAIRKAAQLASQLYEITDYGQTFQHRPSLTGPFLHSIGVNYAYTKANRAQVVRLGKLAFPILEGLDIEGNIEVVRPPENRVIPGILAAINLVHEIGSPLALIHPDTFHMDLWGDLNEKVCEEIGPFVGHFHASGRLRQTPGYGLDNIPWEEVIGWVKKYFTNPSLRFITLESFGPAFRDAVKEIGGEFPADLGAMEGIVAARARLAKAGAFA